MKSNVLAIFGVVFFHDVLIRKLLIFSTWGVRNRLTDAGEIALVHPAKQQQKGSASPSYSDLTPPPPDTDHRSPASQGRSQGLFPQEDFRTRYGWVDRTNSGLILPRVPAPAELKALVSHLRLPWRSARARTSKLCRMNTAG